VLKQTIKYTNFFEEEKERDLYFHLGRSDIARIAANPKFLEEMNEAAAKQDTKAMLEKIEYLVRLSYGVRTDDGEGFVKNEEVQNAFIHSAAYDEFLTQILTSVEGFTNFIKGVFPPKVMKEIQDLAKEGKINDPFAEPTTVTKSAAVLSEQPAEKSEERLPTKKELREMSRDQLVEAFRKHPSLLNEITD
jgi:hypothetical protein